MPTRVTLPRTWPGTAASLRLQALECMTTTLMMVQIVATRGVTAARSTAATATELFLILLFSPLLNLSSKSHSQRALRTTEGNYTTVGETRTTGLPTSSH